MATNAGQSFADGGQVLQVYKMNWSKQIFDNLSSLWGKFDPKSILRWGLRGCAAMFSAACLGLIMAALILDAAVWTFGRDLPSHENLANYEPPIISRIFSAEGRLLDEFAKERRLFSPVEEIPPLVRNAFISAEDKNFFLHSGYDPLGMVKAVVQAMAGERLRGASTITQQVMKNFLLSNDRSVERKIREILLASRLERTLSKDQILELYLNEIFLGQSSYGVTAAAQTYFNKSLDELNVEEAAYLAALPKAPSRYHPVRHSSLAVWRRNFVINEMVENGYISGDEGEQAKLAELRTVMSGDFASFKSTMPPRDYFTDEIRRQLATTFGEEEFFAGGLTIRATIDEELQATAGEALRAGLEKYDRGRSGKWTGTGLVVDGDLLGDEREWRTALSSFELPRDIPGWERALVVELTAEGAVIGIEGQLDGSRGLIPNSDVSWVRKPEGRGKVELASDFLKLGEIVFAEQTESEGENHWTLKQFPEVQGAFMAMDVNSGRVLAMHGGFSYGQSVFNRASQADRQPGSAFKPFVYAAALDSGYTPATIVIDAPIERVTDGRVWRPKNSSNQFYGLVPLRTGIELSRNLMTIRLAEDVGMETVAEYAETFGVYDRMDPYLANSLGSQETTLSRIVAGYAMFANGGERVFPTLVDRVQDRYGRTLFRHDQRLCLDCDRQYLVEGAIPQIFSYRTRVIDPITAYQMTAMMQGVVERGTASRTVQPGVPVAGKTGTTNDSRDAWFVGFTPDLVAGCYIGYDEPRSLGRNAYGSNLCGPVFNEFIIEAVKKYGSSDFQPPEGGVFVAIDRLTGQPILDNPSSANSGQTIDEFFRYGTEPVSGRIRVVDGGFALASDLIFDTALSENVDIDENPADDSMPDDQSQLIRGSLESLSSGGLY